MGALSFGPLANFLMGRLGWKWGMLIFAGLMLTCILFGAIMRPLKPKRVPIQREMEALSPIATHSNDDQEKPLTATSQEIAAGTNAPLLSSDDGAAATHAPHVAILGGASSPGHQSTRVRTVSSSSHTSAGSNAPHRMGVSNPEDAARPFFKKDALFTGSKTQIHRLSHTSLYNSNPYIASVTNIPALTEEEKKKQSAFRAFLVVLKEMTDFSILKNKQILLICIGNIFSMLGYYLPIMCLVSLATEDLNVDRTTASFLLTIFGFCNTIGRFAGGPIALLPHLNPLRVHNALLLTAGILTVLAAFTTNFLTCALYAGLCGFAIAPHMSLMPSVICECVGLDRFSTAFGILFLFRGVTSIIGPPAAGFIKDYTKNYKLAFAIGGIMIIIGAIFHFCVSCVESDLDKDEESVEDQKTEEIKRKEKLDI
jgi:MFS family permease